MSRTLPRLRQNLDVMPSPLPDHPGLLLRDPYGYSQATLIVPPPLVPCLLLFDGKHTDLDLREALVRITGEVAVGALMDHLVDRLETGGFAENEVFGRLRDTRRREFAETPLRAAALAGSAYPAEPDPLRATLGRYMEGTPRAAAHDGLVGIAAPHVSPEGGWESYRAAYAVMGERYRDRTFLILGTSHYGQPERFGITRKPFVTPLGQTRVDVELVDRLVADGGPAAELEDYCHAIEHSIEFQVLFLQHLYGPGVRIAAVLCGPFARATYLGGRPEEDEGVRRFLGVLEELGARERIFWVLGVDLSHIGRRYGDRFGATADQGEMVGVAERDRERLERIGEADAHGFWELLQQNHDDLRWCGASALYSFLKAVPDAAGTLLRYQQWNIDERSVVSFAGMSFSRRA